MHQRLPYRGPRGMEITISILTGAKLISVVRVVVGVSSSGDIWLRISIRIDSIIFVCFDYGRNADPAPA